MYRPDRSLANRSGSPRYTIGKRLPGKLQMIQKQSFLPSPFQYNVKTDVVAPSKFKKVGFGYGSKSGGPLTKLGPGPGDYELKSFTDKFSAPMYKQARYRQKQGKKSFSVIPSPRQCSLAKPMTGGAFDPMGCIRKDKQPGFNYPPLRMPKFAGAANTMFYKTHDFRSKMNRSMQKSHSLDPLRQSQHSQASNAKSGSDSGSISNK